MQLQKAIPVQAQTIGMNPQFYQSIKLMELPIMDLREKIGEELERNPALEVISDPSTVSLDDADGTPREVEEYFESTSDSGFISKGGEEAADKQRNFIEGALSRPETLQEHLLWQLRLIPTTEATRRLAELLIQNLDEDGFHKEPLNALLENEDPNEVEEAKTMVQGFDPVGTCTADYKESLQAQIRFLPDAPPGIAEALSYLELLEKGRISEVAKLLGRTEEEIIHIFEKIKELFPFPGRQFASGEVRYVVPDIQVIRKEGKCSIILNKEEIPVLGLNPFFMKMAESEGDSVEGNSPQEKPARDFARENIKEARWFINSINQRNHTLLRVTRAIVAFQRHFFMKGPQFLAPLTLRDIADDLGLHEATISRTANGKYMQTEWGIYEIRHFFSNSISGAGSGGSQYSKEGVKEIIKDIIESESQRLSDKDISELLAKRGISLARRTVAKYRGELDLEPSFGR